MMKILHITSKIILFIAFLNIFAFTIVLANNESRFLGFMAGPLKSFSRLPFLVHNVIFSTDSRLIKIDPNFEPINNLNYDLYALNAHFLGSEWIISLKNLRNDSLIHKWQLKKSAYKKTDRLFSHSEPRSIIILDDKSIILKCDESFNLFRLDKQSNIIWHNSEYQFHHSINLSEQGHIWTCTRKFVKLKAENVEYWDNSITKIDVETGQMIFHKSITEILIENNLSYLIYGMGNNINTTRLDDDPLHLNDIEPVHTNSIYWQKGDLFLSFRNRSLILLYRPSSNTIEQVIQGPFYSQHDVDIESDSTISLFNNNYSGLPNLTDYSNSKFKSLQTNLSSPLNSNSEVLLYNFSDSSFTSIFSNQFKTEKIFTKTEGLHSYLSTGDLFIENTKNGTVYIVNEDSVILKQYYNKPINNLVEPPHWIRIYENIDFLKN